MRRLSIDEIIEHCKRYTEKMESHSGRSQLEETPIGNSNMMKQYWEHRQVAEWLEELKEARKGFEENRKAGYEHGYSDGYVKAIDDFAERMSLEISESIIWDMFVNCDKDKDFNETSDKIVDYVIDTAKKIAEEMRGTG